MDFKQVSVNIAWKILETYVMWNSEKKDDTGEKCISQYHDMGEAENSESFIL